MTRLFVAVALVSALAGCGRSGERILFLRSDGADLPILVRGPQDSSKLVLFVHGGPGGSGFVYAYAMAEAFDPISDEVMLAFYEQRAAGSSQGNVAPEDLTIARHVEDLRDVLALVRDQYPNVEDVYLLGHSWGGALTAEYLIEAGDTADIAGWINVAGSTNFPLLLDLSHAWAFERAATRAAEEPEERWQEMVSWYEDNPALDAENLLQHMGHVDVLGGTTYDPEQASAARFDAMFFSPYSASAEATNIALTQEALVDELLVFDAHPDLPDLDLPSLFLHGVEDGRVPIGVGEAAFAALGTPDAAKTFVPFERSGHRPFHEEPGKFADVVLDFVKTVP